jgi:formate C-acetyltransferase
MDALVAEVTGWIAAEVARHRTYRGDRFIPSLFCWVMHERLGTRTPATPDGRRAGEALGDGAGPAQGRDRTGPSAALLSATAWDHTPFIGGVAVNLRFSPKVFVGSGADKVTDLVRVFLDRGGFELQLNVVDADTLRRAQQHPEQYRDLVVRIGGYSDYFTALAPAMQAELIRRTEHGQT